MQGVEWLFYLFENYEIKFTIIKTANELIINIKKATF